MSVFQIHEYVQQTYDLKAGQPDLKTGNEKWE